jgi:hypothetical protein
MPQIEQSIRIEHEGELKSKEKTYRTALIVSLVWIILSLPILGSSDTVVFETPIDSYSYLVWVEGSTYYCKNGSSGTVTSSSNASAVINNAWGNMSNGGRIFVKGTIDLGTSGLVFNLTKYTADLELIGEGETGTVFTYSGSDYAITVTTGDAAVGYYYAWLEGFAVSGGSKTTGRNGIKIEKVGRNIYLDRIQVTDLDVGLYIYNTNMVFVNDFKAVSCNTGIKMEGGSTSAANGIWVSNFFLVDNTNYGVYSKIGVGANMQKFGHGNIGSCGTGIYAELAWNLAIEDVYFEYQTLSDINASGNDWVYPITLLKVEKCYFSSTTDYAIILGYTRDVHIADCFSKNHNTAFINPRADTTVGIVLQNNHVEDPTVMSPSKLAENSGSWTGTSPVTVAHGCAGEPDYVFIGVNGAQPYATGYTKNATHIVIYHNAAGSLSGSWKAEYKP